MIFETPKIKKMLKCPRRIFVLLILEQHAAVQNHFVLLVVGPFAAILTGTRHIVQFVLRRDLRRRKIEIWKDFDRNFEFWTEFWSKDQSQIDLFLPTLTIVAR